MSLLYKTRVGLAMVLAWGLPVAGWSQEKAAQSETAGVHYQLTYVWQYKPAFNAAYSGANSLVPGREFSNTFSATAYFGFRPWAGGEIYFNPEINQGYPLSNLSGLGGFTNGELSRAASTTPQLYRQRLFLRQTWSQGGDAQRVNSDINQLAGFVDKNRLVLTVGNFSTLDVFDNNAYAKDPRRQFMNWGHMTYAAFDYAADARGFAWGAAAEWYQGDWVLRAGRMTGPVTPNDLPLDVDILNHYGDQVEVEHAHEVLGQPGKVRLLAWRNRAVLARYRDAVNDGLANARAPDILNVRTTEQIKYGLGVSFEQALATDLGVFFRAMQADGATETYAFTEADQSIAVGLSLQGTAWGRARDTLGVGLMQNGISNDRREYLEAGGMSFFIGDGKLQYRPEQIFEMYYSLSVARKTFITFDYQRIHNPAYNADRGPVDIGGVRLHTEF